MTYTVLCTRLLSVKSFNDRHNFGSTENLMFRKVVHLVLLDEQIKREGR